MRRGLVVGEAGEEGGEGERGGVAEGWTRWHGSGGGGGDVGTGEEVRVGRDVVALVGSGKRMYEVDGDLEKGTDWRIT